MSGPGITENEGSVWFSMVDDVTHDASPADVAKMRLEAAAPALLAACEETLRLIGTRSPLGAMVAAAVAQAKGEP